MTRRVLALLAFFATAAPLYAATITSQASGSWSSGPTWVGNSAPLPGDSVIIASGHTVTLDTSPNVNAFSVQSGGSLNSGTNTLNISGNLSVDGSVTGGGTLNLIGTGNTMTGSGTIGCLFWINTGSSYTMSSGPLTLSGTAQIDGALNNGGEIYVTASSISGGGTLTQLANGILHAANTITVSSFSATAQPNLVDYTATSLQNVRSGTYYNLKMSGGSTKTLLGTITVGTTGVGGDLTINSGVTVADGGNQITGNNTGTLFIGGTGQLNLGSGGVATSMPVFGTYSFASTSTVAYIAQVNQTVAHLPVYGNLTIGTGTATATPSGNLTVAGNVTISTGTFDLQFYTHTVGGNWTNSATFLSGTGTVDFNSASASQAIARGGSSFYNVMFDGAGVKGASGSGLVVNGDFTINSGSNFDFGTSLHQLAGNFTNNGTINAGTSTVDFSSAASTQSIGSANFFNVTFSGGGPKTATGVLTIGSNLQINSGATFNAGNFTHNVAGSWTNNGTFNANGSTINFNGSSAQSIGSCTFNSISFTGGGTKTFTGAQIINKNLTVNSLSTLNAGTGAHSIGGTFTNDGTVINSGNSWTFNGTVAQTIGGTAGVPFADLTISNASNVTLTAAVLVNGILALGTNQIITGANILELNTSASLTRSSGYVNGKLKRKNATGSVFFDVGTSGGYSPVQMNITGTADVLVSAVAGSGCCTFAGSNHLQHFWQLLASSTVTADLTFQWLVSEVAGFETSYIIGKWNGSSWSYPGGTVSPGPHTAAISAASITSSTMSWIVGQPDSLAGNPNIVSFSPTSGPAGTSVVLSGSGFTGASAVSFNGTNASTFTVDNDGQITVTVPGGATTGPISVTTPAGTANSSGNFTIASAPSVTGFSPTAGSEGVTVVVTGSSFTGATAVTFNGMSAAFTVDSDNQITTTVPSGATSGPISVTTPSGTTSSGSNFTVNAPGLIQSATSGNWTSPSTWVGNVPPGTLDTVEILNGHTVTLTANAAAAGIAVDSGATLNLGTNTLTVSGSGSFFGPVNGSGSLTFSTNSGASIDGNATIAPVVMFSGNRTLASTHSLAFSSGINITTGATVTNNGAAHIDNANGITGTGTWTQGTNSFVTNGGPFLPLGTLNAAASGNTIDYNGAAQTVNPTSYHNLSLSGSGAKTMTSVATVANNFSVSGTATATAATNMSIGGDVSVGSGSTFALGTFSHTVGGSWTVSGSVTQGTSTVTFNGSAVHTIARGTSGLANVIFAGSGTYSCSGSGLFATGNVTINAGSTFDGGSLFHQITGNWTNNGTFTTGTSTVEFQGSTASTINGAFATLSVNKSGAGKVLQSGVVTVSTTTQLTAGTLQLDANTHTTGSITGSGALSMTTGNLNVSGNTSIWTGTFTAGTGTVTINGSGAQTIRGGTYYIFVVNKSAGTATMANTLTVTNTLYVAGGTLFDNGFNIGGSGALQIDNGATLKLGTTGTASSFPTGFTTTLGPTSNVIYASGQATQQILTTPTYGILTVDAGGGSSITKSLNGSTLNANALSVTNSSGSVTLDLQNKTVNIGGDVSGAGAITFATSPGNLNIGGNFSLTGLFTAGTSTVTFNGTGAQSVKNGTYNNLIIAGSGTATLTATTQVNGAFVIAGGSTLSMNTSSLRTFGSATNNGTLNGGANTLDLRGDFANNGTFNAQTGTVTFGGTLAQAWSGSQFATLNNVTNTNATGITFNFSVSVNGVFTLNGGNVTIASGRFIGINNGASVSRLNTSYFIGQLVMYSPAATTTTFHLGTAAGYAPVDVTPSLAGDFTITSNAGAQPNATGANLLSRYWTIGTAATTSVDLTFSYNAPDVAGNETIYTAGRYLGSWTRPSTTVNTVTHQAFVTGITSYAGDWTVGEPLSLGASTSCTAAPSGVVSWYRAEGNANDSTGPNAGTLNGGAAISGGKVGQAFSLNGTTAYVSAADHYSLNPSNVTIEGWFYLTGGSGTRMIVSKPVGTGVEDSFMVFVLPDNTIGGGVGDSISTALLLTTTTVTNNAWHHFAYTYDGAAQGIYLDGSLANAATTSKVAGYDANALLIGADRDNGSLTNFFPGLVDEVTLYNRALSAGEVSNLFAADFAGKCFAPSADVSVAVSAPASGTINIPFTYTIAAGNAGPYIANGISLSSTIPANLTYNSHTSGSPWTCSFSAGTLTCTATSMSVGALPQITVNVTPTATGTVTPAASISTTTSDTAPGNDSASTNVTINGATADLAVTHTASPASTSVGGNITYSVQVTNNGPSTATNVTVTDVLPGNVTFVSAPGCTGTTTVTCSAGNLLATNSATFTITTTAATAGSATASASATATETDSNTSNNTNIAATATVTGSTSVVTNTNDSGAGSLRQALLDANSGTCTAPCNVTFAIGSGAQTIVLNSGLPAVVNPVIIDGATQPGYAGSPLVTVDENNDTSFAPGLQLTGGNSTVRGLVIRNSHNVGLVLGGSTGGNTIETNVIGPNDADGIRVLTSINVIGGSTAAKRNVISGNGNSGVVLFGTAASGNTIQGNYIGTNAAGNAASGNLFDGIQMLDGASSNVVDANVISGNGNSGIYMTSSTASPTQTNSITGNLIGTDATGAFAVANGVAGIYLGCTAPNNSFGGNSAAARNVISGNPFGVRNLGCGSDGNKIAGNYIGTAANGTTPLGNGVGIALEGGASQNLIGGTAIADKNVIANSTAAGVSIADPAAGNAVLHNSITGNGTTGINLDNLSVAAVTDAGDPDTGANNLQNPPSIGSATLNGSTLTVGVNVDSSSVASTLSIVVEVFKADASGQGATYLGTQCFNGNNISGNVTVTSAPVAVGDPIVATATSYATICGAGSPSFNDGTSPFSVVANVTCAALPATITAPPSVCPNGTGYTASVPATAGATYTWIVTNGSIGTGQGTASITFNANASGSVGLSVTATLGACTGSGSTSVPIGAPPTTITPSGPTTFCSGGSVILSAPAGYTYLWSNSATTQSITLTAGGNYSVTVTDASGCSATSAATTVTVNPPPPVPTITGASSFCAGSSTTLSAPAGYTYLWSNGATTQSITITAGGNYTVTVTDANGCSTTSAPKSVTVTPAPSAVITAPASAPPNSTGLAASVPSGATSYNWTITNGTITAGQGTSSITFSIGTTTATLGVTVTNASCTATGSKSVLVGNTADLAITLSATPDPVNAGGTLTYTAVVTNNGPSAASSVAISDALPAGTAFVSAAGSGWTCNGTVHCSLPTLAAGATSSVSIVVNAPATAGPLTNSVTVSSATADPKNLNNTATVTTLVTAASNCPSAPALISPASGATGVTSPVSLQWTAVANASSYDVFTGVDGAVPTLAGSTAATSLFVNLPSGVISWFVVAQVPNCGGLTSVTSQFTIPAGANCATHAAPTLMAPAQNATVASSHVDFSWQPVPEAIGYRVSISINGAADTEIGTTTGATTLAHDVPSGTITWVVDALFNGCPSTRSSRGTFIVPAVDPCATHGTASLIAPANNSTSASSSIDFHWTAVDGASGYRVWAAIDDTAAAVLGETGGTSLHAVISSGLVDWYVEALFDGCASTSSGHFTFTVPKAQNCGNEKPSPIAPSNNSTTTTTTITFNWTGVLGAAGYELYLSLDNGTPVLAGSTTGATPLTKEVGIGTIKWFVRALFDGCPPRDSQAFTFLVQPPANCRANVRPVLASPIDGATAVTSPVTFEWSNVGATSYKLFVNAQQLNASTPQPLAPGAYEWYVEALFNGCTSLRSATSHFTVIQKQCAVPAKPTVLAPSEVSTGIAYKVRWLPVAGADAYTVQEANNAAFANATTLPATTDNKLTFTHNNAGTFFYRVRGISNCSVDDGVPLGGQPGPFSAVVGVTILPQNTNDGAASPDAPVTLTYTIPLDAALAGQTFAATPTQPWLTVVPPSGTIPAGGLTLTVTANTTGLPLGTSLGGVTITTSTPSAGKYASAGSSTSTTTLSVNVVQPVSPTSKSTPPPDALIIPAVAHADGFNSHFQSDVRITNTSPQVMKYEVTFTPSGETGLANGKQTQIDVDPGRTIALDDVMKTWFASGTTDGIIGTLEIRPLTTTSTKVTSNAITGLGNFVTFASSRTFNNTASGTYGQYIPAIPFANFVGKSAGTITLQQIAQSAKYRTNLGFVEGSGQSASLLISIFGSNGQKIKELPFDLKGGQHTQLNAFLQSQNLSLEDGRIEVKVASGSGRVTAYASVLDNETSDPLLVTPVLLTSNGSTKYVVPGVADLNNGVANWRSDVRIFNPSSAKVDAQIVFISQSGASQAQTLSFAPNEVKQLDNVLQSTFGVTNDGGAIHINTASPVNLIATARTYNLTTKGTFGQFISAVTPNDAAALGTRPLQLLQVEESDRYRTNVGLAEVSGKPAKVEVTIVPPDSRVSIAFSVDMAANEFRQLNQILKSAGLENTYNARVSVQVIEGAGRITAYASVIDAQTQDPTLVQAQ